MSPQGAVSVAGQSVRWLRDKIKLLTSAEEIGEYTLTSCVHVHTHSHHVHKHSHITYCISMYLHVRTKTVSLSSEVYAKEVQDTGDVYFVPAFSGLFAPHWQPDARG